MSQWNKPRTCRCGRIFALSDHGHGAARAAADALETKVRTFDRVRCQLLQRCPDCLRGKPEEEPAKNNPIPVIVGIVAAALIAVGLLVAIL